MIDFILRENIPTQVVGLMPDRPLDDALKLMNVNKSSYVMVLDGLKPLGVITERDMTILLEESFSGANWEDITVDHVMTSPVITVRDDTTLLEAIELMREVKIRHAPVVNELGEITGVLTPQVVIDLLYRGYMQ